MVILSSIYGIIDTTFSIFHFCARIVCESKTVGAYRGMEGNVGIMVSEKKWEREPLSL